MIPSFSSDRRFDAAAFVCLITAGLLLYSNNYQVPWYFDDSANIIGNRHVYAFSDFFRTLLLPRGAALVTFALNYSLHGEALPGYHLVNNAIHIAASITVYLLFRRVFAGNRLHACAGALIFLAHPLQSQSVTYIVQRMTSLSALFALLCLYCFVRGRDYLADGGRILSTGHAGWYSAMFLFCALAVTTKQNTAFLPAGLFVFGRYFLDTDHGWTRRRSAAYLAPFLIPALYVAATLVVIPVMNGARISEIGTTGAVVSPFLYFMTEWQVAWVYIKLLFVPLGQTLDYGFPIVKSLNSPASFIAGAGLLLLVYLAYRTRNSALLLSFSIVWFFLSLAVESSFLPLDPLFEHRLYLPMFGFALLPVWFLSGFSRKTAGICFVLLVTGYGFLTFQRNLLWGDPLAFYEDNLRKAPRNERVHVELSRLYIDRKRFDDAERLLLDALAAHPSSGKLYDNLGSLYDMRGEGERAVSVFQRGIDADPAYEKLYLNLAVVYESRKEYARAEELLSRALRIKPGLAMAHYNLGVVRYRKGELAASLESFRMALANAPFNQDAMYNLALVAHEAGNSALSRETWLRLQRVNPVRAGELAKSIGVPGQ